MVTASAWSIDGQGQVLRGAVAVPGVAGGVVGGAATTTPHGRGVTVTRDEEASAMTNINVIGMRAIIETADA